MDFGISGLLSLAATIFWVVMLVDAIRRDFRDNTMKIIWILVIVFTHFIGALVYYFIGRPEGRLRSF
jgi:hypothetical protein